MASEVILNEKGGLTWETRKETGMGNRIPPAKPSLAGEALGGMKRLRGSPGSTGLGDKDGEAHRSRCE